MLILDRLMMFYVINQRKEAGYGLFSTSSKYSGDFIRLYFIRYVHKKESDDYKGKSAKDNWSDSQNFTSLYDFWLLRPKNNPRGY